MSEIIITNATFSKEVLESKLPVLVDFWAGWCGPCKMLAPIVSELADEYDGKLKVCKLNIDEDTSIAVKYGIASIPTLLLFKDGEIADRSIGYVPKDTIKEMLFKHITL